MHTAVALASTALASLAVFLLGAQLPDQVASHFNAAGVPDSYMKRGSFLTLMLCVNAGLPLFTWGIQVFQVHRGKAKIPRSSYWFAREHREQTVRWLNMHAALGSAGLAVFLTHALWLVVLAHQAIPVALPAFQFWVALAAFLLATACWVLALRRRFASAA